MRRALVTLALLATAHLSGCLGDEPEVYRPPRSATELPPDEPWTGRNVTVAGHVEDGLAGTPLAGVTVTVGLYAPTEAGRCGVTSIQVPWQSWRLTSHENGTFGPLVVPEPEGDAYFLVEARTSRHFPDALRVNASSDDLARLALAPLPKGMLRLDAPPGTLVVTERDPFDGRVGWSVLTESTDPFPVAAGHHRVVFSAAGHVPARVERDVPRSGEAVAESPPLENAPDGWPRVTGSLTDADGAREDGHLVVARDADGRLAGSALTTQDGDFTVVLPSAGEFTVGPSPALEEQVDVVRVVVEPGAPPERVQLTRSADCAT